MPSKEKGGRSELFERARRRSQEIDALVDLIPARVYMGENLQVPSKPSLDPVEAKTTSQLLREASMSASRTPSVSNAKKSSKKRQGPASASQQGEATERAASRAELTERLHNRIAEMKQQRSQKQSETDKAKAKAVKEVPKRANVAGEPKEKLRKLPKKSPAEEDGGPEAGRLIFDPKIADLPFEATVTRKGKKVRRLRSELRRQEVEAVKLSAVTNKDDAERLRKDFALKKALQRARGQKVHDDTHRLRKAQKQLEARRAKGKESWLERVAMAKQQELERQQKRKENLADRASHKKKKKLPKVNPDSLVN